MAIVANYREKLELEKVPEAEVKKFAKEKNAIFKLVSSVTGCGVKELFEEIGKKILNPNYVQELEMKVEEKIQYKLNKRLLKFINY